MINMKSPLKLAHYPYIHVCDVRLTWNNHEPPHLAYWENRDYDDDDDDYDHLLFALHPL